MSSNPDQNPLKDWRSLGNNVIWRSDGAIVYPLHQPPRSQSRPSWAWGADPNDEPKEPPKPRGPWLAMHPSGGFLGRFPNTELAVRAIDSRHPLVAELEYQTPPQVQRILDQIIGKPELLWGLSQVMAEHTRSVLGPWELSHAFGGSMIRQTANPIELHAVVAHFKDLYDHDEPHEGASRFPKHGTIRWKVWDGRVWIKGATNDIHEAMDAADEVINRLKFHLVPGRPVADSWQAISTSPGRTSDRMRRVWAEPAHRLPRGQVLATVKKVGSRTVMGVFRKATWALVILPAATRVYEARSPLVFNTRREAQEVADEILHNEGWRLR